MGILSPWWIAAVAGGLTIPPLVALYYLKLKRRHVEVPSTLLWKRAVQDLQVNSPFQRLKANLLLLLQLLVLLLAAFALLRPVLNLQEDRGGRLIMLIDQSASMAVREKDGKTRLDIAKEQADIAVDNMGPHDQAMVIAFGDRARVVSTLTGDRAALKRSIESIEQTDGPTRMIEAVTLAEAYSQNMIISTAGGRDFELKTPAGDANAVLFSDGRIADADAIALQKLNLQFVNVAETTNNVGIVAMEARRDYEHPELVNAFGAIRNFGAQRVTLDAELFVNGTHQGIEGSIMLEPGLSSANQPAEGEAPAARPLLEENAPLPASMVSIAFKDIPMDGPGVLELRISARDGLAADNTAWVVVPPSRQVKVLQVGGSNFFLDKVMSDPELPIELTRMSPEEYETCDESKLAAGGWSLYDVTLFDDHGTSRLYNGNYFFFGGIPQIDGVSIAGKVDGTEEAFFDWDESHPVLRHVPVESVFVLEWTKLNLPREATILIDGETSPVLAHLLRDGRQYLICAFSLLNHERTMTNTKWVVSDHFPVFVYNVIQFLSGSIAVSSDPNVAPGEAISVSVRQGGKAIDMERPGGKREKVPVGGGQSARFTRTLDVGVYRAVGATQGRNTFAVNLFDNVESLVAPNPQLKVGAVAVQADEGLDRVNRPIWRWALGGILLILLIEWAVYNRRMWI